MTRVTPFSNGRRWRMHNRPDRQGWPTRYFVIVGPPAPPFSSERYRLCRIEVEGHGLECDGNGPCRGRHCSHGMEQEYSKAHLKKHATLVEEG